MLLNTGNLVAVRAMPQHAVFGAHQNGLGFTVHRSGFLQPIVLLKPADRGARAVQKVAADLARVITQV